MPLRYEHGFNYTLLWQALGVFAAILLVLVYWNRKLAREIKQRKRAEEALREKTEELDRFFPTALDLYCVADTDGCFRRLNPQWEAVMGYSLAELEGRVFLDFIHPEDLGATVQTVSRLDAQQPVLNFVNRYRCKDGSYRWIEWRSSPRGKLIYAAARDITERIRSEETLRSLLAELEIHRETLEEQVRNRTAELSNANQYLEKAIEELKLSKQAAEMASVAKSDVMAHMSHELRTPLNHIIGFTELVVDKHFGDLNASQEEYLTDVLASSRHLLSLVNDVLDLSKVEAGKLELVLSPVDLRHLLQNSLLMVKEKAINHGLKLSSDFNNIPESIEADERKLKQIVYNLLSNAVKFTPDGGRVELSAQVMPDISMLPIVPESAGDEPWVKISIKDTGIGLKKEDLNRIFDPFEQVESARNRKFQGTGLGLALVRNLVTLHGFMADRFGRK
ncbi:MAG: ATP-binding protein [Pseudomonadota bacterium]